MNSDHIDLGKITQTVWRRKLTVLLFASLAFLCGGVYSYRVAEPAYQATALLQFEAQANSILNLESIVSGTSTDEVSLNTELEVIRSRELIEALVDRLDLTSDPEFNASLRTEQAFNIRTSLGSTFRGLFGMDREQAPLTEEQRAAAERRRTVDAVRGSISATSRYGTYLLNVTAVASTAKKAALLANTLGEIYIEEQFSKKFDATQKSINWMTERARELERDLRAKEDALSNFQADTDLISDDMLQSLNLQAKEFRERLERRQEDLRKAQARLATLESIDDTTDITTILTTVDDALLNRVVSRLGGAEADEDTLRPAIGQRLEALAGETRDLIARIEQDLPALSNAFASLQEQVLSQSGEMRALEQMRRELDVTRDLYQTFLAGLQEATVQVGLVQSDTRIMSRALPPRRPFAPRHSTTLATSLLIGALLGMAAVFILESRNQSFKGAEELEQAFPVPVLGTIPMLPVRQRSKVISYFSENPTSAASEAVRNLRTSLFMQHEKVPQVIMVTSSVPGDGKTTLSLALALNLADLGKKTLLLDGDLRRNTMWSAFPDLDKTSSDAGTPMTYRKNLDVLLGLETDFNAADFLSSKEFDDLLEQARHHYDHIVIDSPPVLVVPDARIVGQKVDARLFAVKWNTTQKVQVALGLQQFSSIGLPVDGLVMTQMSLKGAKKYGYGYSYGGYQSQGRKYYDL